MARENFGLPRAVARGRLVGLETNPHAGPRAGWDARVFTDRGMTRVPVSPAEAEALGHYVGCVIDLVIVPVAEHEEPADANG